MRWRPGETWRRRADLNSLAIAVVVVLVAFLFKHVADIQGDLRVNQCDAVRADVKERQIIVSQTHPPTALTLYWTGELLPQLRERFDRVDCDGRLPRIPKP